MKLLRRSPWILLISFLALEALLLVYPVRNGITRPAIIAVLVIIAGIALGMMWQRRPLRIAWIGIALITAASMVLPGRNADHVALRSHYVAMLRSYEGTRYVWGGENHWGVDCSGLVRAAMVDAEWREGLLELNPALLREAAWLWWHDAAAREMPGGYSGRMQMLFSSDSVRVSGMERLQPGDVAVTGDGSHVFAYGGAGHWIEADPVALRVSEWTGEERPTSIDRPMIFLRWTLLQ